jgi:hypothetical protein
LSDAPSSTPMSSTPVFKAKSTAPLSSTPLSSTQLSHAVVALDQPKPAPPVVTRPFHVGPITPSFHRRASLSAFLLLQSQFRRDFPSRFPLEI